MQTIVSANLGGLLAATAEAWVPSSSGRLVFAAILGLVILLSLIIKARLQPILAILVSAIAIGIVAGMPYNAIVGSIGTGIGNTLKGIALLVGLGSMFGAILEISGGAQIIAITLVDKFGENKAAWALGITGLIIAMPVFFDAGLIILIPLAFSLAKRTKKSTLVYAIPLLAGLAVGHAFIPPTPGPILVANLLGVDLGYVIGVGVIVGSVAMIVAGPLFGRYIGNKIHVPIPKSVEEMMDYDHSKLPGFATVVSIILIPLVLILLNTVSSALPSLQAVQPLFKFIGEPFIALTIATIVAMVILGLKHGYSREELEKIMTKSLEPTGMILLVTACGGVLRYILQDSGLGEIIGQAVADSPFPLVIVAFIVAGLVRISVGSATVAMTMAGGIIAAMPETAAMPPLYLACVTAAIAGGATIMSHFNDSGFWLVKSLLQIDEKTTLRSWTVMETIVGFTGFGVALIISFFA
ncbi:GntP family permease [Anaerotalea alkaliphila]|uniref:Gluconate permease n=1 Tax=Anaerotalea alkaliphila TaxID=2662126 RepID=A0A7X5HXI4_9FIRM|nr:gluconate:H+ symporter [Anaerotalea alkaliphila]NDL68421.1 gluconate permease [Anaerotalea alkaliphila]